MSTIVTRAAKGSPLTHNEVDANFTNLNTDKIESGNTVAALNILSANIDGGTIDGTAIGGASASTGAFTNLSSSGTVSGTGFSNYLASPPAIGGSTPAAITGTTVTGNTMLASPLLSITGSSSGYVRFQGAAAAGSTTYTLPNADGTTGQVLTTNGTGTLTWSTAATSITISNDTSTSTDVYPAFLSSTTGTASTINTSNAKLLYKPSTGEFKAEVPVAQNGIFVNAQTIDTSYTIGSGFNGLSAGPVTVASGTTITVTSGSVWTVV